MDDIEFVPVAGTALVKITVALAEKIWRPYYTPIIGKPQVDYMLGMFQSQPAITKAIEEGFLYFLIVKKREYIGYLAVLPQKDQDTILLSKIYLNENERRKGYGRKAMGFIEDVARRHGAKYIRLTVNKNNVDSIGAYEKMGFKRYGDAVSDIGAGFFMDDYQYQKKIGKSL